MGRDVGGFFLTLDENNNQTKNKEKEWENEKRYI